MQKAFQTRLQKKPKKTSACCVSVLMNVPEPARPAHVCEGIAAAGELKPRAWWLFQHNSYPQKYATFLRPHPLHFLRVPIIARSH